MKTTFLGLCSCWVVACSGGASTASASGVVMQAPYTDLVPDGEGRSSISLGALLEGDTAQPILTTVIDREGTLSAQLSFHFEDRSVHAEGSLSLRFDYVEGPIEYEFVSEIEEGGKDRFVGWESGGHAWRAQSGIAHLSKVVDGRVAITLEDVVLRDDFEGMEDIVITNGTVEGEVDRYCLQTVTRTSETILMDGVPYTYQEEVPDLDWESEFCQQAKATLGI